ncbi:2-methylaconitate cis-trans isomerase PrpF family protein [Thermoactinomyces sp. CICC 10735]|uniref:2-methylaconitate cis-trans isomerase PrpF family protein n=1 Tax=Thermoactinomyces sp. CICC 10735 TaxID=2767430 RepID=UPI0018DC3D6A|nr:PrpF domain-containing protein [Thermoactinomyces sp. CICC 10735]MBH8582474.1 hypothetical protein [Thermoactinomyces sp. CICC 10735]
MKKEIPCTIMRGGTSKGLFFIEEDLPEDLSTRQEILLKVFGSPDPYGRQIDGLGGGTSTTSKVAIISKRKGEKNTVNYTFGQVDITAPLIDMRGNCGNISSAVGPFSIDKGLVEEIKEPITKVRIYNTNTRKYIIAHVPVKGGKTDYDGDFCIPGVPTKGNKIRLDFLEPGGAVTGRLLPTNHTVDILETKYGKVEVSIVDAANPCVFVRAKDLGLTGIEFPKDLDQNPQLLDRVLDIRAVAATKIGLATNIEDAKVKSPAVPKICFISESSDYISNSGELIDKGDVDLVARMMSMGKLHPSFAITGGICLAVAAKINGTLVNQIVHSKRDENDVVRIGHCDGVMEVGAEVQQVNGQWQAVYGTVYRTARCLMNGSVCLSSTSVYTK